MLHLASSLVVVLLAVGLWFRHRRPQLHLRLMISAFVVDCQEMPRVFIKLSSAFGADEAMYFEGAFPIITPWGFGFF